MANFLFWNTGKRQIATEVGIACRENDVDVLVLAESEMRSVSLLDVLNSDGETRYFEPPNVSTWLKFFTRYPLTSFEPVYDDGRVAMRRIRPPVGQEVLMVAAHLPSKLHQEDADQHYQARILAKAINEQELRLGHRNSFVIGDLNMDPFEEPMLAADGLHSVMDRAIASRGTRTVQGREWGFFYNPMWNQLGDNNDVPGTYYRGTGGVVTYFWHTFDQVLLRPGLLEYFASGNARVLSRIGATDLIYNGRIDAMISDHLPVLLHLDIERKV